MPARWTDPEKAKGNRPEGALPVPELLPQGERVAGELVEYKPRLAEIFEGVVMPSVEETLRAHHQNLFRPRARPHRVAFNQNRSLRRG